MATAPGVDVDQAAGPTPQTAATSISPEELARAGTYRMLALLLEAAPGQETLDLVARLSGDDTAFGATLTGTAAAAAATRPDVAARAYHDLFIGVGEGDLVPFGSYYLTGFLHETPLARLRADLRDLGIAQNDGTAEPEDNIATLCEVMAGLITGAFGAPTPIEAQRTFFTRHIGCWAGQFFADLAVNQRNELYRKVGALGEQFMTLEAEGFTMEPDSPERTVP